MHAYRLGACAPVLVGKRHERPLAAILHWHVPAEGDSSGERRKEVREAKEGARRCKEMRGGARKREILGEAASERASGSGRSRRRVGTHLARHSPECSFCSELKHIGSGTSNELATSSSDARRSAVTFTSVDSR